MSFLPCQLSGNATSSASREGHEVLLPAAPPKCGLNLGLVATGLPRAAPQRGCWRLPLSLYHCRRWPCPPVPHWLPSEPHSLHPKAAQLTQCSHCYGLSHWVSLQFVHRVLAHELLCPQGGPSCEYYLVLAQTHLLKKDFAKTEEYLQQAAQMDYLVLSS